MSIKFAAALATTIWAALPAAVQAGWVFDVEFGNFGVALDLAVDSTGQVYVADSQQRVQVFTTEGKFLRERAGFQTLSGIAIDEDDIVYVLEACRVRRYTTDLMPLGSWDSCIGQGDLQRGLGIDALNGFVYVATANNVLKFTADGTLVGRFEFGWTGISASVDGTIWVSNVDAPLGLVRHYASDGSVLIGWETALPGEDTSNPTRIAVDSAEKVFVNDDMRVKIFQPNGDLHDVIQVQLRLLMSVELDGDSVLFVGTAIPGRVMKFYYEPLAVEPNTWGAIKARFR